MSDTPPNDDPIRLPDDHPLVKTLAAQKEQLKELKAKAAKLDEIEEANKSEAQKQADRIAALERDNEGLKLDKLRADVAGEKGVPANLISGKTREEFEAAADALLAFRGSTPTAPSADGQGDTGSPVGDDKDLPADDVVAAALGR